MLYFLHNRIVVRITNLIRIIILRINLFIWYKKPANIPPIDDPLFTLSATTLARKIRHKEITSFEITLKYIERIKKVNVFVNAVIDNRFRDALYDAKVCDDTLKANKYDVETLEREKPLYGVPFTVKEACSLKGCSYTGCSLPRKGLKATSDGAFVELLRNAGAIPLCVTNTPEMCASVDSNNLLYGSTLNPYDTRLSAGGSSSGEGALLGAGASLIGIGSDIGGSIRIPALFNGVFGYKPTPGILSIKEHYPLSDDEYFLKYLVVGPLTRYAEDLYTIMKVLSSKHDYGLRLDSPVNIKQLKVYYRLGFEDAPSGIWPTVEIQKCILKATDYFEKCGVQVEKLPIKWSYAMVTYYISMLLKIKAYPTVLLKFEDSQRQPNSFVEMGKSLFGLSQYSKYTILFQIILDYAERFPNPKLSDDVEQAELIRKELIDLLGEDGVFIYPTFQTTATFSTVMPLYMLNVMYSAIVNIFRLPSVHVPMGLDQHGLPIGFQVIAAPYQDRLCLAVAKELEKTFGGWIPPSCD